MKKISFIAGLLALTVFSGITLAGSRSELSIFVGQVVSVKAVSVERVFIRQPELLDVVEVYPQRIELLGKKAGFTVVEIWSESGKRMIDVNVLSEDLSSLKERISDLISRKLRVKGVMIKEDTLNSKVILEGTISQQDLEKVKEVTKEHSEKIINFLKVREERDLVQVDVEILELTKELIDQLGIDWSNSVTFSTSAVVGSHAKWIRMHEWSRSAISATVSARFKEGKGKILARPKMVCLSGKEASFVVGGEVPILTYEGGEPAVEYKEYGVKLDISPLVEDDGVLLGMKTEISELDSTNDLDATVFVSDSGSSQFSVPAFSKRTAETQLFLKDGETLLMSGLLKDKISEDDIEKVPGLGDIPILGALFKSKDYQQDQTELVITLTPKIVRNSDSKEEAAPELSFETPIGRIGKRSLPLVDYTRDVQNQINRALTYPAVAQEAGWQGSLKIGLSIASSGNILEAKITESSGYEVFDKAALDIAQAAGPYPRFPESIEAYKLWVEVPVVYSLE